MHAIELTKKSAKKLQPEKMLVQIKAIMDRAMSGGRDKRGWSVVIANRNSWAEPEEVKEGLEYTVEFEFDCKPSRSRSDESIEQDWQNMIAIVNKAGNKPQWFIKTIDDEAVDLLAVVSEEMIGYVPIEIPDDWPGYFDHIYERDPQIRIIMSAINASIRADFQDRFHCALIGDPACGKSDTLAGLKKMVGAAAYLEYDATNTTQAGAIKDLEEREELPRLLIVEEIEKAEEHALRWLLSLLDQRAEIRKVTYTKNIQKETRMLGLCTVNDFDAFKKIMYGALASRFSHQIWFPVPSQELLRRILEREIKKTRGNKRWIKPALEYAMENKVYDPRNLIAICKCGGDDLISGQYQDDLESCRPPERK